MYECVKMSKNLINIRGSSNDPFERYKMPMLSVINKNKGQYNECVINGLDLVAKSLKVSVEALVRWFSSSMKTQHKLVDNTLIIKGTFDYLVIEKSLRKFISTYVLCSICDLPELVYLSKEKNLEIIVCKCKACGHREKIIVDKDKIWKIFQKYAIIDGVSSNKTNRTNNSNQMDGGLTDDIFYRNLPDDDQVIWESDLSDTAILKRKQDNQDILNLLD